ncbi:MAG: family oxidoreductase [Solirubrobacterales bacterium]|nr:family oxidoreductase [Solirubrobacterales bacterium]
MSAEGNPRSGGDTSADESRVALVTGGSRGLGAAIVRALASRGLRVAFTYRERADLAEELCEELAESGGERPLALRFDQESETGEDVIAAVLKHWGRLDSLVLSAGIWSGGRIDRLDPEEWWRVVEVDLRGVYRMARAAVAALGDGPAGSITIVSSTIGIAGFPGDTAYSSAKSGLIGFGRSLAKELAGVGTRVNVIAPGFVESDATAEVSDAARERLSSRLLIDRFGRAEEIGAAAAFLSEDATYSTGTVLVCDGGFSL